MTPSVRTRGFTNDRFRADGEEIVLARIIDFGVALTNKDDLFGFSFQRALHGLQRTLTAYRQRQQ